MPRIGRGEDGSLVFTGLAPWDLAILADLPRLLEPDQPGEVKRRLYPFPSDDEDHREEWKKLVHPELFALIASARKIILEDLRSLAPEQDDPGATWRLEIPDKHVPAWLSGLNAARLTLASAHDIGEAELRDEIGPGEWDDRWVAVAKIRLLGFLQMMILDDRYPPQYPETSS